MQQAQEIHLVDDQKREKPNEGPSTADGVLNVLQSGSTPLPPKGSRLWGVRLGPVLPKGACRVYTEQMSPLYEGWGTGGVGHSALSCSHFPALTPALSTEGIHVMSNSFSHTLHSVT